MIRHEACFLRADRDRFSLRQRRTKESPASEMPLAAFLMLATRAARRWRFSWSHASIEAATTRTVRARALAHSA